jgi:hypothetical protein
MKTELETTIEAASFDTLNKFAPKLLETVKTLVQSGQTPKQIAKKVERQDVFLAGLVEMAATYIQEQTK